MPLSNVRLDYVLIFFVYGLGYFTMGLALALETLRSPLLAEKRELRLLAVFGLLHGIHEWIEIFLLEGVWLGLSFPPVLSWLRVGWLTLSFVPLVLFGVLVLGGQQRRAGLHLYIAAALLLAYILLVYLNAHVDPENIIGRADALARYLWAVPGGFLAALALRSRARRVRIENRLELAQSFQWAALGFGVYGITQLFVSSVDMFPANYLNAELFLSVAGFPIQVIRAAMSVFITANLLFAIRVVDREREHQLLDAQQARLDAMEQIQRDLEERESLRKELLRHTVIAQEEERARIARELHDETAQYLTALSLNLATLNNSIPKKPEVNELIYRLQTLSRRMSQSIYRMVHDLRPAQLDDLGLIAALQYLADDERRIGLKVAMQVDGPRQRLDPLVETVFFRVAQEALTNVARHAQSDCAAIHMQFTPGLVSLCISDEGIGFDYEDNLSPPRGWGLAGMRERVESVGGELFVSSIPGRGTSVEITLPLVEKDSLVCEEPPR
jgi:signal transduction histidine kinase